MRKLASSNYAARLTDRADVFCSLFQAGHFALAAIKTPGTLSDDDFAKEFRSYTSQCIPKENELFLRELYSESPKTKLVSGELVDLPRIQQNLPEYRDLTVHCDSAGKRAILFEDSALGALLAVFATEQRQRKPHPLTNSLVDAVTLKTAVESHGVWSNLLSAADFSCLGGDIFPQGEALELAEIAWQIGQLNIAVYSSALISRVCQIRTPLGSFYLRKVGELLIGTSSSLPAPFGALPETLLCWHEGWLDKIVKVVQTPLFAGLFASIFIGSMAAKGSFVDLDPREAPDKEPPSLVMEQRLRVKVTATGEEKKLYDSQVREITVLIFKLLQSLVDDLKTVNLSSASSVAEKLDDLSIGGKLTWMVCQNLIPEYQPGAFRKTAQAINELCAEDAEELTDSIPSNSKFLETLWDAVMAIGATYGYTMAVNFSRVYACVPLPACSNEHDDLILDNVLKKGRPAKDDPEEELEMQKRYLLAAISTQEEIIRHYEAKTHQKAREPSVWDFDTRTFSKREHWAEGTPAWQTLSLEQQEGAKRIDKSINEVPVCAAEHYSAQAASKGTLVDEKGTVRLESLEALRHAPKMFGKTGTQLRKAGRTSSNIRVVARKKTESGKHRWKKVRQFWVAHYGLKTRLRTFNSSVYAATSSQPGFAPGKSGLGKLREVRRLSLWLRNRPSRIIESSDRSAWSESHNHVRVSYFHSMLGGTVNLPPGEFHEIFSAMKAGIDGTPQFSYSNSKMRPAAMFKVLKGAVTFQGFTIFADTSFHRGMVRATAQQLVSDGFIKSNYIVVVCMDDVVTGFDPALDPLSSAENHSSVLRAALTASADTCMSYFDIDTNAAKSLKGREKFISLNEVRIGFTEVASYMKFFGKVIYAHRSFLETSFETAEKAIAFSLDLKKTRVPAWIALQFGLNLYYASRL